MIIYSLTCKRFLKVFHRNVAQKCEEENSPRLPIGPPRTIFTFPDANASLMYPIKSSQLSPTPTSSLCNPHSTPSSMDQTAKNIIDVKPVEDPFNVETVQGLG
jgi:hypothetical protein